MFCLYSFNVVLNRTGLKAVLSEKFLEVFGWFEDELEDVQKVYENEKVTCLYLVSRNLGIPLNRLRF